MVLPLRYACACMGPMYGEPYCPCQMDVRGLARSAESIAAEEKANADLKKLFDEGVFRRT